MQVVNHSFISMLEATLQFTIPLYQRRYSWEKEQCEQLWKDIIALTKNEDKSITHFMGSLVDVGEVSSSTGMQKYCIVDGQQRLTTVMILLIALRDYCKKTFSTADRIYQYISESLLKNTRKDDPDCWKLLLLPEDQIIFKDLIDNDGDNTKLIKEHSKSKSRLIINYQYFQNKLEHTKLDPEVLCQSISNLNIVEITLAGNQENVQEIFESLNSTGKSLAQSDLIRNYILMNYSSDKQNYLYETYWKKLEQYFPDSRTREADMDEFFRMYLSMNLCTFVSEKNIYDSFKELLSRPAGDLSRNIHFDTVDDLCKDILLFIEWYSQIKKQANQNEAIQSVYDGLNAMKTTILIPLFLFLNYSCYETRAISETTCAYLMQLCITYVYRRKICGFSISKNNKYLCEKLLPCLAHHCTDDKDIIHALEEEFAEQVALGKLPPDPLFIDNFISANIYTMGQEFCSYTLCQLEDFNNKNHPGKLAHSIEHIMPQNSHLNNEWQEMLGEDWKDIQLHFLHTPGNLTLTNYNSEMSDRSFKEKCEIDYQQSPFTHLNSDVRNCHTWTEKQIIQRSRRLAALAVQVWAVPQVTEEIKDKALLRNTRKTLLRNTRKKRSAASITDPLTVQEALNDTSMITSTLPKSLIFKDSNYSVKHWKQMLVIVFEALYNENPDIINQFAAINSKLFHTEAETENYYALGNTRFFTSRKNAEDTLKVIQKLLSFYDDEAGTDYCTTTKFTLK